MGLSYDVDHFVGNKRPANALVCLRDGWVTRPYDSTGGGGCQTLNNCDLDKQILTASVGEFFNQFYGIFSLVRRVSGKIDYEVYPFRFIFVL